MNPEFIRTTYASARIRIFVLGRIHFDMQPPEPHEHGPYYVREVGLVYPERSRGDNRLARQIKNCVAYRYGGSSQDYRIHTAIDRPDERTVAVVVESPRFPMISDGRVPAETITGADLDAIPEDDPAVALWM